MTNGPNLSLEPVDTIELSSVLQSRLKRYILQNKLRPGDKLPSEDALATQLGVSRTAVREALRSLEALGLIEARQGVGRVVRPFNFDAILNNLSYGLAFHNYDILQFLEIRKALDIYFIAAALQNMTAEDDAILSDIVARMAERSSAGLDAAQEDYEFHAHLFHLAKNPLASQLFEITWTVRQNAYNQPDLADILLNIVPDHQAILAAIKARDLPKAQSLLLAAHATNDRVFRQQIEQDALIQTTAEGGDAIG
jgi:DNA-binding FadR family transcriptional regulator